VFSGQGGQPGGAWNWSWGNRPQQDVEFDLGDIGEIFEDFFGGGFGAKRSRKKDIKKGRNIQVDIEIDLQQTLKEFVEEITLKKYVTCQRCEGKGGEPGTKIKECFSCRGTGQVQQVKKTVLGSFTVLAACPECKSEGTIPEKPCNVCKGDGRVKANEKIEIQVPAGVDTNQIIRVVERGEAGRKGGRAGDLFARILVKQHPVFERRGDDLLKLKRWRKQTFYFRYPRVQNLARC
jgi:molecular chaperone DnaJ